MPTTFSRLDAADTRQLAEEMAAEAHQLRVTNRQFVIALLIAAVGFAVFVYLLLW